MELFKANFDIILIRFGLVMMIVIMGFLTRELWISLFALPILLMSLLGVKLKN